MTAPKIVISVSPPMVAVNAGPPPLYGTCVISMPRLVLSSSAARCPELPAPPLEKLIPLALDFDKSASSRKLLADNLFPATTTKGILTNSVTGARSLNESNGKFL